jgi:hypothetical protein
MDRRSLFFAVGAVAALLLWPLAPPDLRWVSLMVSAMYAVLSLACLLDSWNR